MLNEKSNKYYKTYISIKCEHILTKNRSRYTKMRQFCHVRRINNDWLLLYGKPFIDFYIYKLKQKEKEPPSWPVLKNEPVGHLVKPCVGEVKLPESGPRSHNSQPHG